MIDRIDSPMPMGGGGEHACTTVERSSSTFSPPRDVVTVTTCFPNSSSEQRSRTSFPVGAAITHATNLFGD